MWPRVSRDKAGPDDLLLLFLLSLGGWGAALATKLIV
jgi:hypothetical protein